MLIEYIQAAMQKARYERLEDDTYCGEIPECPGTIAFGDTLQGCQKELQAALEDWLMNGVRHGDELPVIDGINLNTPSKVAS